MYNIQGFFINDRLISIHRFEMGKKSVTIRTVDFILVEQLSLNVLKNIYFLIPL